MTKEEEIECKKFADFKNVYYYTAEESKYGVQYAALSCYWGDDSIVNVPETINGYPVLEVELATHPSWDRYPPVSVENVKEVHLPASLKKFDIMNWASDEKQYALEKIVFGGTKEQFQKICSSRDIEAILTFTKIIECTDGVFEGSDGQTEPTMRYYLKCADGSKYDGTAVYVTIDWSRYKEEGGISVIFIGKNGNEYPASSDGSFGGIYYFELHIASEDPAQSIALRFDVGILSFEEENIAVGITVLWAYDPNGGGSRHEFVLGNVETLQ